MSWQTALGLVGAVLAGGAGFLLFRWTKWPVAVLLWVGPLAAGFLSPYLGPGFLLGAWPGLAAAGGKGPPESFGPKERLAWPRVLQDALSVDLLLITALIYVLRTRTRFPSRWVLATAVFWLLVALFCYFYAVRGYIGRKLRIIHGYLVGIFAFLPWAYFLARRDWAAFGLGSASFLLLPAFFLGLFDLERTGRARRLPRRKRARKIKGIQRTGRRLRRPIGFGRP